MAETTIAWTNFTQNFWVGCTEASDDGCATCYARELDKRYQFGQSPDVAKANRAAGIAPHWGVGKPRHRTSLGNWAKPARWNREAAAAGRPTMVFTSSLADFFDNEVDRTWRDDAWAVIRNTPHLRWQILTKRVPNIRKMLPADWGARGYANVGLVASVVNQTEFMRDLDRLLAVPARWHGFSMEPQVSQIVVPAKVGTHPGSIWLITGGDSAQPSSGVEPRPYNTDWARSLILAGSQLPNVHVFVKQLGARPLNAPPQTDTYAGENMDEWPADIRVRQFPPELLS